MYKRHVGLTGGGRGLVRSMHADLDLVQIKNDGFWPVQPLIPFWFRKQKKTNKEPK